MYSYISLGVTTLPMLLKQHDIRFSPTRKYDIFINNVLRNLGATFIIGTGVCIVEKTALRKKDEEKTYTRASADKFEKNLRFGDLAQFCGLLQHNSLPRRKDSGVGSSS